MQANRNSTFLVAWVVVVCAGLTVLAQDSGNADAGKKIFHDSGDDLEYPSCAHCHAVVSASEELAKTDHIRPAFPVYNTSQRGGWKNKPPSRKGPKSAGDAGNICVRAFQKRKKLPASDVADLNAFLASVSPGAAKPRKIKYAPKLPASLDGGDAAAGKKNVEAYCGGCHGKSDDHLQFELRKGRLKKRRVAMKVRGWIKDRKKKDGIRFKANNGMMSFFAKDRLPDKDLLHILAYIGK